MNNAEFSPSRRAWNRFFTAAVWVAAALVIVLVAGIIAMVLARGIPHIRVEFLTTTASVLKGTDGILPAILNTLSAVSILTSANDRLCCADQTDYQIHGKYDQKGQCQISWKVAFEISPNPFSQYFLHLTNPPILLPVPLSHCNNLS